MGNFLVRILTVSAGLAILALPRMAFADEQKRIVNMHNSTDEDIRKVYYWSTSTKAMGPNRLNSGSKEKIKPDGTRVFDMDDGTPECLFNVDITFADGTDIRKWELNVCSSSSLDVDVSPTVIAARQ